MPNMPRRPPLALLVGAGHAHLYALKRSAAFTKRGYDVVLVAPDDFWYSGLATGVLGGAYPPSLDRVDVGVLVGRGGGRFVRDLVIKIDPAARAVFLEQGEPLRYDVLSLNLGSEVPLAAVPGAAEHGYAVKPIRNLWRVREDLEGRFRHAAAPVRVVVAGGGATACEVAANVEALARARGGVVAVTVLASGDDVLPQLTPAAAAAVRDGLARRGILIQTRSAVARVEADAVWTEDGRRVSYDVLIHAVGLEPPRLLRDSGLPVDDTGALLVDGFLRSPADERVFGGGDCVAVEGKELAKVGVYAIREAPVLFHNLLATLEGRSLRRFRPQQRYLLVLNLGDGTGLATWGGFHWHGRLAFRLKDWLDRRFLREYRA